MIRKAFYIFGTFVLSGCYTYAPAPVTAVQEGETARFHVTEEEGRRLAGMLGPQVETVGGTVVARQPERFDLTVESFTTVEGGEIFGASRPLSLDLAVIRGVETRQIDRVRSAIFAALLIAVPVVLVGTLDIFGRDGPADPDGGGGNPRPN